MSDTANEEVDSRAIERAAVALLPYEIDRAHQVVEEVGAKSGLYYRLELAVTSAAPSNMPDMIPHAVDEGVEVERKPLDPLSFM